MLNLNFYIMVENTNKDTFNLMRKTWRSSMVGDLLFTVTAFLFTFVLSSCENGASDEPISCITAVSDISGSSGEEEQSVVKKPTVVFTGNDIQWFNPNTREIKFKKDVNYGTFKTYQKIHFKLNDDFLFTAQTYASQHHSFIIKDLVLFIDQFTQKCYLHDCYPLEIAENDPDTKINKEKRSVAWDSFVAQLRTEYKIK